MMSELDEQTCKLREEVLQANQLRKEQLVELGLLREEEKTKMAREHEQQVGSNPYLHVDYEQQVNLTDLGIQL